MSHGWVGPESENPPGLRLAWPVPPPRLLRRISHPALLGAVGKGQRDRGGDPGVHLLHAEMESQTWRFPFNAKRLTWEEMVRS